MVPSNLYGNYRVHQYQRPLGLALHHLPDNLPSGPGYETRTGHYALQLCMVQSGHP